MRGSHRLRFVAPAERTIKSIALNVANTPTHMVFNPNPARFHVDVTDGIDPANISASYSADVKTVTLSFADGSVGSGDSFTFGLSVFAPAEGSTHEDAVAHLQASWPTFASSSGRGGVVRPSRRLRFRGARADRPARSRRSLGLRPVHAAQVEQRVHNHGRQQTAAAQPQLSGDDA